MIEELGRHGYKLSAGTLYPILHGLEERGYVTSTEEQTGECRAPGISRDGDGRAGAGGGQTQGARIIRRTVRGQRQQKYLLIAGAGACRRANRNPS
jgi:hypothetical protein